MQLSFILQLMHINEKYNVFLEIFEAQHISSFSFN